VCHLKGPKTPADLAVIGFTVSSLGIFGDISTKKIIQHALKMDLSFSGSTPTFGAVPNPHLGGYRAVAEETQHDDPRFSGDFLISPGGSDSTGLNLRQESNKGSSSNQDGT
jgi:hypothetical protein